MIRHIYQHAERFDIFFNRLAGALLLAFHLLFTFSNGWATKKINFVIMYHLPTFLLQGNRRVLFLNSRYQKLVYNYYGLLIASCLLLHNRSQPSL